MDATGAHPHLHGRPPPSLTERGTQLARVLHRPLDGRRPADHHHAPEGKLSPAQRHPGQRQGHADRILDAQRRHPHVGHHHRGSGLPDGAARLELELSPQPAPAGAGVPVLLGHRNCPPAGRRAPLPARHERSEALHQPSRRPARQHPRRRGDDVSGVQDQGETTAVRARLFVAAVLAIGSISPAAQVRQHIETTDGIEVLHVRGPVYMLIGAGANATASVGPDGVLVVDTGSAQLSDKLLAAIRGLQAELEQRESPINFGSETRSEFLTRRAPPAPPKPIRFVINTHVHPDHVGGNFRIAGAGRTVTGGNVGGDLSDATQAAAIFAHETVLHRMTKQEPSLPFRALPTDTYFAPYFKIGSHFNGEGVQLLHMPAAHTDGDTMVWFRGSDVISTGDVFVMEGYPRIDLDRGGSINGVIEALNSILDLAFPEFRLEGGTLIVPGHGRLSDSSDVAYYRDMVTTIRDRVQGLIAKGATLEQVKASKPTLDYDTRFGATSGAWTTDMF